MRAIEVVAAAVVAVAVIAASAYKAKNFVAPQPIDKGDVGLVMLANAMDRINAALTLKDGVDQLNCTAKGDRSVACVAIGSAVFRVSFAAAAGAPAFELAGQRAIDGKLYVNALNGVPAEIPAREVGQFTSAFDGRATVHK